MAKFETDTKKEFLPYQSNFYFYIINILNISWMLFIFIVLKLI
jgi:hypothetical protein